MTLPDTAGHDLHIGYRVGPAARRRFAENGFVKLAGVLSPVTVQAHEPEVTARVVELNTQHLPLAERDTYGQAFLQVTNLRRHSERVRELVFSRRLAGIAAELLGVPGVRLRKAGATSVSGRPGRPRS